ncbi:MAG: tRNA threonylcarbamoyladenosine biosynthesis protein TsaB [Pseudonocardiales bacterium]|nr:tRNA threonylcarbamoyladenosine biosynthesis protein TsaB [Pseudonocardiales bacterium]
MFVLAIDTSSAYVVVGVTDGGRVLAERRRFLPRGHGELLSPSIAACLAEAGLRPAELGAVVAGVGPGPYTGLRVGLVTAAAMGDALSIPTYGVCSLDPIGRDLARDEGDVLVVTDARRKEVYWARYDEQGHRLDGPHVDRPADVDVTGVGLIGGAGVQLYPDAWPADIAQVAEAPPRPGALDDEALTRIRNGAESEPLTPLYLRRPDAVEPGAPKPVSQR